MMHFTDTAKAISAVHHQLKPGGTFAAGYYGIYALHEPRAQAAWQKLINAIFYNIIQQYGVDDRSKRIACNEAAGLDSVGLPAEDLLPAQRYDYNFPDRSTLRDMLLPPQYGLTPISCIREEDVAVRDVWDEEWFSRVVVEGLKGIASTLPHDEDDEEIRGLWQELEGVIGEREGEGAWMVSLLLATMR